MEFENCCGIRGIKYFRICCYYNRKLINFKAVVVDYFSTTACPVMFYSLLKISKKPFGYLHVILYRFHFNSSTSFYIQGK